jgi:two-component system sensor histidine kinase/response regulator
VRVHRYELGLRFEVADTGIGMDAEGISHLFQSFSQVDGSMARRFGGTGLGLAISRRLAEVMDGTIGVASRPGLGSTFWFTVRVELQAEAAVRRREEMAEHIRDRRVLVVDDNATNRRVACAMLRGWGFRVEQCELPSQALATLRAGVANGDRFVLALLDFQMPEMDGLELGRTIKADPALAATHLIVLTSVSGLRCAADALGVGFAGHLTKPVKPSHLFDCVLGALSAPGPAPAPSSPPQPLDLGTLDALGVSDVPGPLGRRAGARARILLAEDNEVNKRVALKMLERLGYRADSVGNGAEALSALALAPYDLILMDCQMPEMDGYDATREIRRLEGEARHTPIVAMTANAMQGDRERCLAAGMDDYVPKPVRIADLAGALDRWLQRDDRAAQRENCEPASPNSPALAAPP